MSPDGKLVYSFHLTTDGAPGYSINYHQKSFILTSALGLDDWQKGLVLTNISFSKKDTTWKPVYGERSLVRDHYRQMIISLLKNNERSKLQIQVRAYNAGIAFRYVFPEHTQSGKSITIKKESQSAYSLLPLNNWPDEAERPLVLQLADGRYACIAEAALVNYSRSKFSLDPQKAVIKEIPDISFYDALPTVWDDTKIIEGKIGAYGTIARRHGDDWYVGSLNVSIGGNGSLSLYETFKSIFFETESDFRIIGLVIAPSAATVQRNAASIGTMQDLLKYSYSSLPANLQNFSLPQKTLTVLIYDFHQSDIGKVPMLDVSKRLSARTHLENSGLGELLNSR